MRGELVFVAGPRSEHIVSGELLNLSMVLVYALDYRIKDFAQSRGELFRAVSAARAERLGKRRESRDVDTERGGGTAPVTGMHGRCGRNFAQQRAGQKRGQDLRESIRHGSE